AGLVNYFINSNVDDEQEETRFVEKRETVKNFCKFCSECGAENEADSQFCRRCGTKL
ncbi:unnamed protein product, partial [marine sediment metagenome]